jgi:hypothetical protein
LGFTVIVTVLLHPLLSVYVMMLVPAEIPVTSPVELTVATPGDADTHGFTVAGVPEPANWVVDPTQTFKVPVIVGRGLTVTVTVKVAPTQLPADPDVGVMVYVAVCRVLVGLVRVPLMFAAPLPAAPPVMPPVTVGTAQVYVVPAGTMVPAGTPSIGDMVNVPPLQIVAAWFGITGVGFTVTEIGYDMLVHPVVVFVTFRVAK